MLDLKNVSTVVCGTKGSGKTYMAKFLASHFKKPYWYLIHKDDLADMPNNVNTIIPSTTSIGELETTLKAVKEMAIKKQIDCFILDEAEMFIPKDFRSLQSKSPVLNDLVINNRHYNLALIFISRRPQSLPTQIFETSDNIFLFAIEGKNINEYFSQLHQGFEPLIPRLSKEHHNYIHKSLGQEPKLMSPIKIERSKKKNDKAR
jgi:hypothetical protein